MWFVLWLAVWSIYVIAGALICHAARRVADAERASARDVTDVGHPVQDEEKESPLS